MLPRQGTNDHALVIGASIAGLLVGHVLARHFRSVTILERDGLSGTAEARKGVPQGRHAHVLVQGGEDALDALLGTTAPGRALSGAVRADAARDLRWFQFGVWKARFSCGLTTHWCDRPRFEQGLRTRILQASNIRLRPGHRVTGLLKSEDGGEVVGVRAAARASGEHDLPADLVVDASGHTSRAPRWLEDLGYPRVPEDVVEVDVGYASRIFERPPSFGRDWTVLVIYPRPPHSRRAGVIYPLDDELCLATLIGWVGDHPPADDAGFLEFARSLAQDDIHRCLCQARPRSAVRRHVFPASRWRRFERMQRWPSRLLVVGDAVCRFNPVYGQGMTVAARDALAVAGALERSNAAFQTAFARRLQRQLARHRHTPWLLATTSDFRFPEVRGRRPPGLTALNWYVRGILEIAGHDARAHQRFLELLGLRASPLALFDPRVAAAVLRWRLGPGRPSREWS